MGKEIGRLRENFIFYLTGLFLILGLKCYYHQADCDSLLWILAPTARWVECLSGIPFTYISGAGYVNHDLRMVIAASCSGVRFMTITFAMLVFSFVPMVGAGRTGAVSREPGTADDRTGELQNCGVHPAGSSCQTRSRVWGFGWIAVSAFFSWVLTVFVNGLRIITAVYLPMYLEEAGLMEGMLTQDRLHTMIGVVVYFTALLVLYRLAGGVVQCITGHGLSSLARKCAPPVFWYFTLTLGLPFVSRVCRGNGAGFMEFAVLVTGCCGLSCFCIL